MADEPHRAPVPDRSRWLDGGLDEIPLPPGRPGRLWVCGRRAVGPDPDAALVRAGGAELVVCLNERNELRDHPDYPSWLERNTGGRAMWFPIPDLHAPPVTEVVPVVAAIVDRLVCDQGVIVHCAGGIGRAPTLAICVLLDLGEPLAVATDRVRTHRPGGGPEVGAQQRLVEAYAADAVGRR